MIKCETKLKTWGNSIGLVIPKEELKRGKLKPDQLVRVIICKKKMLKVKDIFGKLKNWNKSTEEIMREIDKELDSKWL